MRFGGVLLDASERSASSSASFVARSVGLHLDAMLGFASGVMLAASYWSLLAPAIEIATLQHRVPWVPAAVGFATGALFLAAADRLLPHLHPMRTVEHAEGPRTTWSQTTLLIFAITLHNIPERAAVALPLRAAGVGAGRAFLAGTASAAVEPVAAVVGAGAVIAVSQLLPYAPSCGGSDGVRRHQELIPSRTSAGAPTW